LIKSKLTIFGQKGELKKTYKTMAEMQERINQLESENVTLRDQIKELSPQA
jgi:cell shape-determining protein MreC